MKNYNWLFLCIVFQFLIVGVGYSKSTTTVAVGTWTGSNAAIWSNGIPIAGDIVTIAHNITLNGYSTPIVDLTINSGRTLQITGSSALTGLNFSSLSNSGNLNINNSNATVSGGVITNDGSILNNAGVTIHITGNFTNNNSYLGSGGGALSFEGTTAITGTSPLDVYNILISTTATVTVAAGIVINLYGDFTNNNTNPLVDSYTHTGTINFMAATVIGGVGITSFRNMNVVDFASVSVDGTNVSLTGILTLEGSSATFDADGGGSGVFRVRSLSVATGGRIASLPNTGNFNGNVTVERFLPGVTNGDYRYISVPVTTANASMLRAAIGVTGNFSDKSTNADFSTINDGGNSSASVYSWNPTTQQYVVLTGGGGPTTATPILNTVGYAAYNFSEVDRTISYRGTIGKGTINIPISSVSGQFNIVPNPYPSPLDWNAIYEDNQAIVDGSIHWRTADHVYTSYAADLVTPPSQPEEGQIATGQSVWVESAGGGSNLVIQETHKSAAGDFGVFIRRPTPINYFRIRLASETQDDYAVIRFHGDATDDKDKKFDAVKRRNGNYVSALGQYTHLNISSYITAADKDLAINSVDELSECSKVMGLKITDVKTGPHSFRFTSLETLQLGYKITLIDHFTNEEKVVSDNFEYAFAVTTAAASFGDARFQLKIEKPGTRFITVEGQTLVSNIPTGNQWFKDGQLIQGATSANLDVTASGTYTVKTTINGCEGAADNVVMAITALPEEGDGVTSVYPNPTTGKIIINLPQDKDALLTGISLYDSKGSLITDNHKDASLKKPGEKSIDISASKNGIYILNLISGQHVKSVRLIKK